MARHSGDKSADATEVLESEAVEETPEPTTQRHGFFVRLYTGTGAFEVVGRRKLWFTVSGMIVAIAIASIGFRGFNFGIDFEGGTKVSFPRGQATVQQVEDVFRQTLGSAPQQVVIVGNGASATVQIRSETLSNDQTGEAQGRAWPTNSSRRAVHRRSATRRCPRRGAGRSPRKR